MSELPNNSAKPPQLSPRRKRFADAFLNGLPVEKAFIQAGYAAKSANSNAHRLMVNNSVIAYISFYEAEIARRNSITQDEIVSGIRDVITKLKESSTRLKDANQASSAVPLLKGYELLAKMGGFLRDQGIDPEQRPAFVGISINMGNGKIEVQQGRRAQIIDVKAEVDKPVDGNPNGVKPT